MYLYTILMPIKCYVTVTNIFIYQTYLFFHIYDHLYMFEKLVARNYILCVYMCMHTDRTMDKYIHNHSCLHTSILTYMHTYVDTYI